MTVDHVVVLCLENRSFDHLLGYLDHPDPDFGGLRDGLPHENPGYAGGAAVAVSATGKRVLPFGPDHSHDAVMLQLGVHGRGAERRCRNDGFVTSYELKARGKGPGGMGGILAPIKRWLARAEKPAPTASGRGPLVMRCMDPGRVPVVSTLALQFAVFDHWFCSVPGETWPNRNYLHAATSDDETDIEIRFYTNRTIFELLEDNAKTWHIYHDDTPQVWAFPNLWDTPERHANWYPTARFAEHAAAGTLPTYSFIEPNHRPPFHTLDHIPQLGGVADVSTSQHPENNLVTNDAYDTFDDAVDDSTGTDFARGDRLVAGIYEALRANPELFARTLLLITYDEHGGFYDHVPPPTDVPPPGGGRGVLARFMHALWHHNSHSFDFRMLGPRVPAVLVSPLIEPGTVVHDIYDHASVPATLRQLFAPSAPPLTARDTWARRFDRVVTRDVARADLPDLSQYVQASAPPTAAPVAEPVAGAAPEYYESFMKQADEVRRRLRKVGEPEIASVSNNRPASERAAATTAAFAEAARRHRRADRTTA